MKKIVFCFSGASIRSKVDLPQMADPVVHLLLFGKVFRGKDIV